MRSGPRRFEPLGTPGGETEPAKKVCVTEYEHRIMSKPADVLQAEDRKPRPNAMAFDFSRYCQWREPRGAERLAIDMGGKSAEADIGDRSTGMLGDIFSDKIAACAERLDQLAFIGTTEGFDQDAANDRPVVPCGFPVG